MDIIHQSVNALSGVGAYREDIPAAGQLQIRPSLLLIGIFTVNLGKNPDYGFGKLGGYSAGKPAVLAGGILHQSYDIRIIGGNGQ